MEKKRYVILDALRGFAILGIILANFPEFSLWTFSDPAGWTATDKVTRAVQTFLVDGKFYTIFSLLFGMGFSIQLANAEGKLRTFYRRMTVLLIIGLV
ncbi:MAG: heparan-alpha-glucosaminide N-acetyltransferase domain-containing protein, partial [Candidatus Cryptobacteroides sp.]|nr:heparan-alpha-glucosaminide N-acetyltransferase domain-containing protein [Candidatus Cryptobacteroides sp.]